MRSFDKAQAALEAGQPPDFLFSTAIERWAAHWAYEDRLVDLEGALGPVLDLFDADAIEASTLLNGKTGRRGLYALPMGRSSNHVHVWNSLLERAGFTLADIPKEWEAFWSFWCDQVQPAVRQALGRDDIWGVGFPCRPRLSDTSDAALSSSSSRTRHPGSASDGRLQVDDPAVRAGMVEALAAYTAIWRKGCTPPDSTSWTNIDNNKAFLAQTVVMTPNSSLSIPARCARRSRRLLRECRDHRLAAGRERPAARHRRLYLCAPWSSRPAGTLASPATSSASSPRRAGSPIG